MMCTTIKLSQTEFLFKFYFNGTCWTTVKILTCYYESTVVDFEHCSCSHFQTRVPKVEQWVFWGFFVCGEFIWLLCILFYNEFFQESLFSEMYSAIM